ncbi:hypothetical protein KPH14_003508 [Odynerus spinipes]|uniref:Uncharacterized protein n=1 Tax=Odynerus spinipes TaxID=1348599 RepID=A0AAD9RCU9_9HYME|nr:hypothetical protein KPH14_003508 [Odynerus spinipes]
MCFIWRQRQQPRKATTCTRRRLLKSDELYLQSNSYTKVQAIKFYCHGERKGGDNKHATHRLPKSIQS